MNTLTSAGLGCSARRSAAKCWPAVGKSAAPELGVSLVPCLVEDPAGQAVVRVPVVSANMPTRRILTCVRRGSRHNPLIALGIRALEEAVRDHQSVEDWPQAS
ncbi:hypothetical protein ACIBL8_46625 [Streptomyces sp. NPDC050523]|uniref:hypothetical protein n=1 Tax=Streptomyces sp. NPDC050523 TaxID=3365622 RepID=UPI003789BE09